MPDSQDQTPNAVQTLKASILAKLRYSVGRDPSTACPHDWFEAVALACCLSISGLQLAVPLATYSEFLFPILLVLGIATRFSAAALMVMALVIQIFVFPTSAHFFGWAITIIALAMILISRGAGVFSLDAVVTKLRSSSNS